MYTRICIYLLVAALIISAIEFGPFTQRAIADARKHRQDLNQGLDEALIDQIAFLSLPAAKETDHTSEINAFLKEGADPNARLQTPPETIFGDILSRASVATNLTRNIPLISYLLDHGANPNLPVDRDNTTPLFLVADKPELISLLKSHGARDPLFERTLATSDGEIADINEALVRHLLPKATTPPDPEIHVYFLSLLNRATRKEDDPSSAFMKRLADVKVRLAPSSESKGSVDGVFDKQTGERGESLSISEIRWIGADEVEVGASWFVSGVGAGGNTYTMKKTAGKWTVVKEKSNWIS